MNFKMHLVENFLSWLAPSSKVSWRRRLLVHRLRGVLEPAKNAADIDEALGNLLPALNVGPGDLVIDLGANEGLVAEIFANRGADVIAVEPNPVLVSALARRLARFPNSAVIGAAVSDTDGFSQLFFPAEYLRAPQLHSGSASLLSGHALVNNQTSILVWHIDFSRFLKNVGPIKFLKVDIEGAEQLIWPAIERNFRQIEFLAVETHEAYFGGMGGWVARAREFIDSHSLGDRWTLGWP